MVGQGFEMLAVITIRVKLPTALSLQSPSPTKEVGEMPGRAEGALNAVVLRKNAPPCFVAALLRVPPVLRPRGQVERRWSLQSPWIEAEGREGDAPIHMHSFQFPESCIRLSAGLRSTNDNH